MEKLSIKEKQVLYVDDDQENLDGFHFSFRNSYKIFLANSIAGAWKIIESNKVKVVISDQRMPEMSGIDFLAGVAKKYPDIIRIVLTAHTDIDSVMQAINKGMVYRFLTKPWNNQELANTLENAMETYFLRKKNIDLLQNLKSANKDLKKTNQKLRKEIEVRKNAQSELARHKDNLENLVKERTQEIERMNEELSSNNEEMHSVNEELNVINEQLKLEIQYRKKVEEELEKYKTQLEKKVAEQTKDIVEREARLSLVLNTVPLSFYILPKVKMGTSSWVSEQIESLTGFSALEFLSVQNFWLDRVHPDDKEAVINTFQLINKQGQIRLEYRWKVKEGNYKWFLDEAILIKDNKNEPKEIIGVWLDITERKINEEELRSYREHLEALVKERTERIIAINEELKTVNEELYSNNEKLEELNHEYKKEIEQRINAEKELKGYKSHLESLVEEKTKELKHTINELKISEDRFKSIVNGSPMGIHIYELNRSGELIFSGYNNAADVILRFDHSSIVGKKIEDAYPNLVETSIPKNYKKIAKSGGNLQIEEVEYRDNNVKGIFEVRAFQSSKNFIVVLFLEITERKQAEKREKEQLDFLTTLLETVPIPVFYKDKNLKYKGCNSAFEYSTGFYRNELIGKTDLEIYPKELALVYKKSDEKLLKSERTHSFEAKMVNRDDTIHDIIFYKASYTNIDGEIIGIIGAMFDITDRKKYENAISESEINLKESQKLAKLGYWWIDFNTNKYKWSEEFYNIVGLDFGSEPLSIEDFLENIVYPDDRELVIKTMDEVLNSREVIRFDFRINSLDGRLKYCEQMVQTMADNDGKAVRIKGTVRDITDRKLAEIAMAESEKKFRNIFNNSNDGIVISSLEGEFKEVNDVFLKRSELTKSELERLNVAEVMPKEFKKVQQKRIKSLKKDGVAPIIKFELVNKSGTRIPVEIDSKLIDYEGGKAVLSVIRDITERKMTEKKVLDAIVRTEEKERERFAKNLHDDLGPLLSSIKMYMNSFINTSESEKQVYIIEQVNEILVEAIQTTKQVSNDLSPHILTNYGLVSSVENFVGKLSDHIQISFNSNLENQRLDTSLETTYYRIIKELINNTIKHAKAKNIKIGLNKKKKKLILIYSDDGIGFDIETIEKKGMGLYNLISRIRSLNGRFEFDNSGQGIKIYIEAPLF